MRAEPTPGMSEPSCSRSRQFRRASSGSPCSNRSTCGATPTSPSIERWASTAIPADPEAVKLIEAACGSFRDQVAVMARGLALELDEVRFHADFAVAEVDTDFGFMTVGAGRIAAIRGTIDIEGTPSEPASSRASSGAAP